MTDEELIETVAEAIAEQMCADDNSNEDIARAAIPVAQAPLLARIAELEKALREIAAEAYVPINELPNHDQPNGWRTLACARIDIARQALRSTQNQGEVK